MTDLIGRRKRRRRRSLRYGEDYQILSEKKSEKSSKDRVPIIDRHIDGA
jgi:hypothetical protein